MNTKQKIIHSATKLFNTEGCIASSMRAIAMACDMSLSNLQHHFMTKETLLKAILEDMTLVFDEPPDLKPPIISLSILKEMNIRWLDFQKHYRFYFVEISAILQSYRSIRKLFNTVKEKRLETYNSLFSAYIKAGLFKPEPFPGFITRQAELLWFTANYYLSTKIAEGQKVNQQTFDDSNKVMLNIIYPMLSDKGIVELMQLN